MNHDIETHHVGDYTGREHVLAGDPAVLLNIRPVVKVPTARRELLEEAADLVDGDRNAQYGDPVDDFRRTAAYWSTHLGGVLRRKANECRVVLGDDVLDIVDRLLDPHDVAVMMQQLKQSRLAWMPHKRDTWADAAGYVACGWDCVTRDDS